MATENIKLVAQCLCKTHTFTTSVSSSKLPLAAVACHCDSCRHLTGGLYSIDTPWPGPRESVDTSTLHKYDFSANLKVLFCGTCSSPMFFENLKDSRLSPFVGVFSNLDVDLLRIESHIYVGDTKDGGASMWFRNPNSDGSAAKRFKEGLDSEEIPHGWPESSTFSGYESTAGPEPVPFHCHCNGVNLLFHRGKYEGKTREELRWFIDPKTHKNIASFDACDSCRLSSGVDLFNWTYSELSCISFSQVEGKAFPGNIMTLKAAVDAKDPAMGTLAYYSSSAGVERYFCKVCSACIFYAVDDRPEVVDVGIGLLAAKDGARAESLLSWALGGKISWSEDVKGGWREDLVKTIAEEAEKWRIERGYPKNWRRAEREAAEAKGEKYY